jgi:adenylate cyclase
MERRLAAILAADVVGYSRLMERDESGTVSQLMRWRQEVLEPAVAGHHGRVVKHLGDGALVEFASAVNAVQCAIVMQAAMARVQAPGPTEGIRLRIGINLGDVVVEDCDLYGEGVNVAARIEALAEPGGVNLSQAVLDQVRGKVEASFEDTGQQEPKNIARAVRIYRLGAAPVPRGTQAKSSRSRILRRSV